MPRMPSCSQTSRKGTLPTDDNPGHLSLQPRGWEREAGLSPCSQQAAQLDKLPLLISRNNNWYGWPPHNYIADIKTWRCGVNCGGCWLSSYDCLNENLELNKIRGELQDSGDYAILLCNISPVVNILIIFLDLPTLVPFDVPLKRHFTATRVVLISKQRPLSHPDPLVMTNIQQPVSYVLLGIKWSAICQLKMHSTMHLRNVVICHCPPKWTPCRHLARVTERKMTRALCCMFCYHHTISRL